MNNNLEACFDSVKYHLEIYDKKEFDFNYVDVQNRLDIISENINSLNINDMKNRNLLTPLLKYLYFQKSETNIDYLKYVIDEFVNNIGKRYVEDNLKEFINTNKNIINNFLFIEVNNGNIKKSRIINGMVLPNSIKPNNNFHDCIFDKTKIPPFAHKYILFNYKKDVYVCNKITIENNNIKNIEQLDKDITKFKYSKKPIFFAYVTLKIKKSVHRTFIFFETKKDVKFVDPCGYTNYNNSRKSLKILKQYFSKHGKRVIYYVTCEKGLQKLQALEVKNCNNENKEYFNKIGKRTCVLWSTFYFELIMKNIDYVDRINDLQYTFNKRNEYMTLSNYILNYSKKIFILKKIYNFFDEAEHNIIDSLYLNNPNYIIETKITILTLLLMSPFIKKNEKDFIIYSHKENNVNNITLSTKTISNMKKYKLLNIDKYAKNIDKIKLLVNGKKLMKFKKFCKKFVSSDYELDDISMKKKSRLKVEKFIEIRNIVENICI